MAKLLFSGISVSCSSFSCHRTRTIVATNSVPKISLPRLPLHNKGLVAELNINNYISSTTIATNHAKDDSFYDSAINSCSKSNQVSMEVAKLHLIMEIVADRVEMHKNVGTQRDNWNHLLLTSINMMTLSAATMAAFAAISAGKAPLLALKVSSTVLYVAVTGMLVVMNKIQPSQLAEEQRNAARLFKQLLRELRTRISLGDPNEDDVNEAMEKVLALDEAYPLPLLGSMIDKFPRKVEPARWWTELKQRGERKKLSGRPKGNNGWDEKLVEELTEVVRVLKRKDLAECVSKSEKALNFNKALAISGPSFTGIAAFGSALLGSVDSSWPVMVGVIGGVLASVVNTIEHGGQVGMVFELYRGASGFLKLMEETIEQNIKEQEADTRENGDLLEIKIALQLGRSVSELRHFAALSSQDREKNCDVEEFASKLF
ncbi:probable F-box protein At4g22030 [Prosopis cineraria]|uniref:probable F-box protein At4g22030 n=1 Tax=Prosopis cineraria TaxID=364024 RepID=UPI00240FB856|nr:probable F-box protein At4g22030 [Prosopis cineraria]